MQPKTPRQVLQLFYKNNNLDADGGISKSYVKIELTKKIHLYFPNYKSRQRAVMKHDIHHLLTGYSASSMLGEGEISAWEPASGCRKYWAAFNLDMSGFMFALWINPWRVFKAFARGRKSLNLYHELITNDAALDTDINELRNLLKLNEENISERTFMDYVFFFLFFFYGLIHTLLTLIVLPVLVVYTIYILITK
ncbi:MAG: hypothetical protein WCR66_13475 [Bacteroidota bacterium]